MSDDMQAPTTPVDWQRCAGHPERPTLMRVEGVNCCRACLERWTARAKAGRETEGG